MREDVTFTRKTISNAARSCQRWMSVSLSKATGSKGYFPSDMETINSPSSSIMLKARRLDYNFITTLLGIKVQLIQDFHQAIAR